MSEITAFILTFNEEKHIERAIRSIMDLACKVYVIDSLSTDRTVELAKALGATVLCNEFVNQAQQTRWAVDRISGHTEWLLRLDADEYIDPDLCREIRRLLPDLPPEVTGINFKRKLIFMDRWIRHGGVYPLIQLRLWRNGCGIMEDRWMDERMTLTKGRAVTIDGGFADHNLNDLSFFTEKHNRYATREAVEVLRKRLDTGAPVRHGGSKGSFQADARRFLKERVYNRIPFPIGPASYFTYRYILLGGFLDGREGLIYHFLQAFWYRFLVGAKLIQIERALRGVEGEAERLALLSELTGCEIAAPPGDERAREPTAIGY
jgi:glycosyltransferase involved in cell wall biosynthesis